MSVGALSPSESHTALESVYKWGSICVSYNRYRVEKWLIASSCHCIEHMGHGGDTLNTLDHISHVKFSFYTSNAHIP